MSQTPAIGQLFREARPCPEMHTTVTDPALAITQITTDLDHHAHTPKMTVGHDFFTPDSQRFIFARMRDAGKEDGRAAAHRGYEWTLCEIGDGYALRRLTDEPNVNAGVLSRDGRSFYYFIDNSGEAKPHVLLKRIDLATFRTETMLVIDTPVDGIGRVPRGGYMYGWASMRSDGKAICASCSFFTDDDPLYATLIVDLEKCGVRGFVFEPYNWRPVGDYYRGDDASKVDHLLMGRSHQRSGMDVHGKWYSQKEPTWTGRGTLHVVTDEGAQVATLPLGGPGEGVDHPSWRGGRWEVTTHSSRTDTAAHWRGTIMCAEPIACAEADQFKGAAIPGARRFELTRKLIRPENCHYAWDQSGTHLVADTEGWAGRNTAVPLGPAAYLWLGTVVEDGGEDPYIKPKFLLNPKSSWTGDYWTEVQPAMSPDRETIFFNSDWLCRTGHPQLFAVRGHTFPGA